MVVFGKQEESSRGFGVIAGPDYGFGKLLVMRIVKLFLLRGLLFLLEYRCLWKDVFVWLSVWRRCACAGGFSLEGW